MTSYTNKMTLSELPEAVEVYANSGFDPNAMRPLMNLLQEQTDYIQNRFWRMADLEKLKRRSPLHNNIAH